MSRRLVVAVALGLVAAAAVAAQQAGFVRTPLMDHDLTVADHHGVMARVEIDPGVSSGRHTHPGEELGYVIEGEFEIAVDGKAPQRLKAGDSFFNPAGVPHEGKNVGATKVRIVGTYFVEKGKPLTTPVK
mgnify:CR=1 FL=1|jgi:quercetin dioxygenase-like cupin family protein